MYNVDTLIHAIDNRIRYIRFLFLQKKKENILNKKQNKNIY
jgi:hypothetical protein